MPLPKLWSPSAQAYFLNINFYLSYRLDPRVAGSISYCTNYLVLLESTQAADGCQEPHQPRKQRGPSLVKTSSWSPLPPHHFTHLLMVPVFWTGISDLPLTLRCNVLLLWPVGLLGIKTLVWTNVPNLTSLDVWQQGGWLKLLYRGPFHFGSGWSSADPSSQVLRKTWSLGFICEEAAPFSVFLVDTGSALWA